MGRSFQGTVVSDGAAEALEGTSVHSIIWLPTLDPELTGDEQMTDETERLVRASARNLGTAATLMIEATRDAAPPAQLQTALDAAVALSSAVDRIAHPQSWCDPEFISQAELMERIGRLARALHPLSANC